MPFFEYDHDGIDLRGFNASLVDVQHSKNNLEVVQSHPESADALGNMHNVLFDKSLLVALWVSCVNDGTQATTANQ
jgi:hypothetical protein